MRKLKQATQRAKARRVLKEKQKEADAIRGDRPASKPATAGARNDGSSPRRAAGEASPRGDKAIVY